MLCAWLSIKLYRMLILSIVLGIAFGAALTIFALENASVITISALSLHVTAPLALVLITGAAIASVITLLALLPSILRNEKRVRILEAQKATAEAELAKYTIVIPVAPPSHIASTVQVESREKVYAA